MTVGSVSCSTDPLAVELAHESDFDWAESEGVRNVLRRASQLAILEWTPLAPVPTNIDYFYANQKVIGVPYSSVKEINKYVGFDVSFHTFMTAVHNPYSVLYTENIGQSPYSGTNCATYYGTVCSAAIAYALDLDYPLTTTAFTKHSGFHLVDFSKLEDLRTCDVLYQVGHVIMIYKLDKDKSGKVTCVTIFESNTPVTSLKQYTEAEFMARMSKEGFTVYRYDHLNTVTDYSPSPYVPVGKEKSSKISYNESLCPNRGDKSVYRSNEKININVFDLSYKNLICVRDGQEVLRKSVTGHSIDISGVGPGRYSVYLENNGKISQAVELIVANPVVSLEITDKAHITFECGEGSPSYCVIATKSGAYNSVHLLDEAEKAQGFVDIKAPANGTYYYKVIFETPFGTVINEPIPGSKSKKS